MIEVKYKETDSKIIVHGLSYNMACDWLRDNGHYVTHTSNTKDYVIFWWGNWKIGRYHEGYGRLEVWKQYQ